MNIVSMESHKKMKYYQLYEKIKQFGDNNYIGSIVIDDNYEIIQMNEKVIKYFDNDIYRAGKYFGNIFGCYNIKSEAIKCGTTDHCDNCKIRKHVIKAFKEAFISESLLVSKYFCINDNLVLKWFEMTFMPIQNNNKVHLMVSIIDLTELMTFKVDENIYPMLSDEGFITLKEEFHASTCNKLHRSIDPETDVYFIHVSLDKEKHKEIDLGSVWRSDLLVDLYVFLKGIISEEDLVCRFTDEYFVLFLVNKSEYEVNQIEEKIKGYQIEEFIIKSALNYSILKTQPHIALEHLDKKNKNIDSLYRDLFLNQAPS